MKGVPILRFKKLISYEIWKLENYVPKNKC